MRFYTKDGKVRPITPKNPRFWWKQYTVTPEQLLKNFNATNVVEEKRKIKRAAQALANKLQGTPQGYDYEQIIKKMYVPTRYNLTQTQQMQINEIRKYARQRSGEPPKKLGDMTLIDWGGHRYIYAIKGKPIVVKITVTQDRNNYHNQDEFETYASAPPELKKLLAPCYDHSPDYTWITMKKVKTDKTGLAPLAAGVALLDLKAELKKDGRNYVVHDLESRQIGKIGDRPVLIDYGFGVSY